MSENPDEGGSARQSPDVACAFCLSWLSFFFVLGFNRRMMFFFRCPRSRNKRRVRSLLFLFHLRFTFLLSRIFIVLRNSHHGEGKGLTSNERKSPDPSTFFLAGVGVLCFEETCWRSVYFCLFVGLVCVSQGRDVPWDVRLCCDSLARSTERRAISLRFSVKEPAHSKATGTSSLFVPPQQAAAKKRQMEKKKN